MANAPLAKCISYLFFPLILKLVVFFTFHVSLSNTITVLSKKSPFSFGYRW